MAFKTILVHLNDEPRAPHLAGAAMVLARATNAHVIGLYVMPPLLPPAEFVSPTAYTLLETQMARYREQAERTKSAFEGFVRGEPFTSEWRFVDRPYYLAMAEGVVAQARAADLAIVSQGLGKEDWTGLGEVPELVALESGRPVLVIPSAGQFDDFESTVTVAWNDNRESARAVFDALPLLQKARRVRVMTVDGGAEKGKDGSGSREVPGADIAVALARHGVDVETATCLDDGSGAGNTLLAAVARDGAGLLVMGAYGHSRFREFVLGGATRDVLRNMTVPVLMSH